MKSVMTGSHSFAQIPSVSQPRSQFDRSSGFKTTFDAGYLIPFFADDVIPGDTVNLQATTFARVATQIVPVMDNLYLDTFWFFVPLRLLWTNFQKFMGEQDNPGDSTSYVCPVVTGPNSGAGGFAVGSLADYFGLPTGLGGCNPVAFHFRAYNLIWNQWFRDENLQNSVAKNMGDGPDTATDYTVLRRGKRHDYFTSCLPWPQKGTAVSIPLGSTAPVISDGAQLKLLSTSGINALVRSEAGAGVTNSNMIAASTGGAFAASDPLKYGGQGLSVDLTNATAATINSFRQSLQLQAWYEKDARGGTRYTEILRSHFGVVSPDARLQRPEYLGGGSQRITTNPISQTSGTSASGTTTPLGTLGGMGLVSGQSGFVKSFVEHGVLLGLASVRADLNYQQGLDRMWSRSTRADFFWPAFAQLGEQTVLNQELYFQGTGHTTDDAAAFGYQERYAEYRFKRSLITGMFRSTYSTPLDMWHLAQKFTSLPVLNSTFIQDTPPLSRIVAVGSSANGQQFLLDAFFSAKWARPIPVYGVPASLGRF